MEKALFVLVLFFGLTFAQDQQVIGNWVVQTDKDAFTDVVSYAFALGENGLATQSSGAKLILICRDGAVDTIGVTMTDYLDDKEIRQFEYRMDEGPIVRTTGFFSDSTVSSVRTMDDFQPYKGGLLAAKKLAVRADSYDGDTYTAVFDLTGLTDILSSTNCGN